MAICFLCRIFFSGLCANLDSACNGPATIGTLPKSTGQNPVLYWLLIWPGCRKLTAPRAFAAHCVLNGIRVSIL